MYVSMGDGDRERMGKESKCPNVRQLMGSAAKW